MTATSSRKTAKSSSKKKAAGKSKAAAKQAAEVEVVLDSQPSIKNISDLKGQLTEAYSATSKVIMDASKVKSVDAATLQLLAAFAAASDKQSFEMEWKQPSDVFCEMSDLADLSSYMKFGESFVAAEKNALCPVF